PYIKLGDGETQALVLSAALDLTYVSPSAYANRIAPNVWIMRAEATEEHSQTLAMDYEQVLAGCNRIGGMGFATMFVSAQFAYIICDMTMKVPSASVPEDFRVPNRRRISAILREIHARPEAEWTVAKLAALAGLSRSTFAEAFHDNVGMGPLSFVTECRMKRAAELLSIRQMTFYEVANRVGYRFEASFARAFKRFYGISPSEFVATRLKENEEAAH
ncbi:MAG: AraC family transcriptional regulator, partial [Caulobacterales bacterium]